LPPAGSTKEEKDFVVFLSSNLRLLSLFDALNELNTGAGPVDEVGSKVER